MIKLIISEPSILLKAKLNSIVNEVIDEMYIAGNGIVIEDRVVKLDDLILDCGTSTTNV